MEQTEVESPGNGDIQIMEEAQLKQVFEDSQKVIRDQGAVVNAQQKLGVLQTAIHIPAIKVDSDYLQLLLLCAFDDKREAMAAADALAQVLRFGGNPLFLLLRFSAQLGVRSQRVMAAIDAVNSYSMTMYRNNNLPKWKKQQDSKTIA